MDKKYSTLWADLIHMNFTAVLIQEMGKYCLGETISEENTELELSVINASLFKSQLQTVNVETKSIIKWISIFYLYGVLFNFKNAIEGLPDKWDAQGNIAAIINCSKGLFEDHALLDNYVFCTSSISM
jgi:hypothetical protein